MSNLPPSGNEQKNTFLHGLLAVLRRITHNWGWKLLSLLLAVCIWGVLVTQDEDLPRNKRFNDLKISVTNSRTLQENGLIVVGGLDGLNTVDIVAQLPQKYYASATADRYQIRADLSRIKDVGRQELTLTSSVTNSSFYGNVISISPAAITVDVERLTTRSMIPVQLNVSGVLPEGYWGDTPTVDPYYVQIAGPESVVDRIARCEVDYNMSLLSPQSGTLRNSLPFVFKDKDGNVLDATYLTVSNQGISMSHVIVEQKLYPCIQVPVNNNSLILGQPAEGYAVTAIRVEPAFVTIAANDLTPYQAEDYTINAEQPTDISGATQTRTVNVALNYRNLRIAHISPSTVTVTIEIKPLSEVE